MSGFPSDSIDLRLTQEEVAEFLDLEFYTDFWNAKDNADCSDSGEDDVVAGEVQREQQAMSAQQHLMHNNPFQEYHENISTTTPAMFDRGAPLQPRDQQNPGNSGASFIRRSSAFGKNELETVGCYIFRKSPTPEASRLKKISSIVAERYGNLNKKRVLSQLRAFLRRKRELVGNKMITAMRRMQRKAIDRDQFRNQIESNDQLIMDIIDEANESFENRLLGIEFCRTKLLAYLDRQSI